MNTFAWIFKFVIFGSFFLTSFDGEASSASDKVDQMLDLFKKGILIDHKSLSETPQIRFLKTNGEKWVVGIQQSVLLSGSLKNAELVFENFSEYKDVFPGLEKAEITESKGKDDFVLMTETDVKIPFFPNDKTWLHYIVKRSSHQIIYRYNFVKGDNLNSYEGFVVLMTFENRVLYFELDIFEPQVSVGKIMGAEKIWVESAKETLRSILAFKVKLENPKMDRKDRFKKVEVLLEQKVDEISKRFDEAK